MPASKCESPERQSQLRGQPSMPHREWEKERVTKLLRKAIRERASALSPFCCLLTLRLDESLTRPSFPELRLQLVLFLHRAAYTLWLPFRDRPVQPPRGCGSATHGTMANPSVTPSSTRRIHLTPRLSRRGASLPDRVGWLASFRFQRRLASATRATVVTRSLPRRVSNRASTSLLPD